MSFPPAATPSVTTESELKQVLLSAAFTQLYGFELDGFAGGECTLRIPFQPAMERPGGIVSGPVFMAAADVAVWLAIMTLHGEIMAVTTELNTSFIGSAKREDVFCKATILKSGRTLINAVAECRNRAGKLLTHHTATYIRLDADA